MTCRIPRRTSLIGAARLSGATVSAKNDIIKNSNEGPAEKSNQIRRPEKLQISLIWDDENVVLIGEKRKPREAAIEIQAAYAIQTAQV